MKKLLVLGLFALCAYKFYQYLDARHDGGMAHGGTNVVRLFVGPGCGNVCDGVEEILSSRNVSYEVVDVSTPEGESYGIRQYPLTVIGERKVLGNGRNELVGALAEAYGDAALTPAEREAMRGHFDADGNPLVVLYGTRWCTYCNRQRLYFDGNGVSYVDVDVEASPSGKSAYDALQGAGYPLVFVGYRRFDGYKEREVLDAIAELRG